MTAVELLQSIGRVDFGGFSRAEVEQAAADLGLPVEPDLDWRTIRYARLVRTSTNRGEVVWALSARVTSGGGVARAHRDALDTGVRMWGSPFALGGPGAWTAWRDGGRLIRLSRSASAVAIRVEPVATWGVTEHPGDSGTEPDHTPCVWSARTEVPVHLWHRPRHEQWTDFQAGLRAVLGSLAQDVATLAVYIGDVTFVIDAHDDASTRGAAHPEGGAFWQGFVDTERLHLELRYPDDRGEPVVEGGLPVEVVEFAHPTAADGRSAAEAILAAMAAWGIDDPARLRITAWPGVSTLRYFALDGLGLGSEPRVPKAP